MIIFFNNVDKVFYKRNQEAKWQGPAVVLGRDSSSYLLKHSYQYIKVHPRDLQLFRGKSVDCSTINTPKVGNDMQLCRGNNVESVECRGNNLESINIPKVNNIVSLSSGEVHSNDVIEDSINDDVPSEDVRSEVVRSEDVEESNDNVMACAGSIKRKLPKVKTHVEFLPRYTDGEEDNEWRGVYIHSRAGKATGKYGNSLYNYTIYN